MIIDMIVFDTNVGNNLYCMLFCEATLILCHVSNTYIFFQLSLFFYHFYGHERVMMISSFKFRSGITSLINESNTTWRFCKYLPKQISKKWDVHGGVIVLVLFGVPFSVPGITTNRSTGTFTYVHLCNEGKPLPINYLTDLSCMGVEDITPRHAIRNMDGTKCGYFVLEFIRRLISFGTELDNLDRSYIHNHTREIDDDVIAELDQLLEHN